MPQRREDPDLLASMHGCVCASPHQRRRGSYTRQLAPSAVDPRDARFHRAPCPDRLDHNANQLLAALPHAEWQRWLPQLESVEMPLGQVLYESGTTLSHVYFPTTVDRLAALRDGGRRLGRDRRRRQRRHRRHLAVHGRRVDAQPRRRAERGPGLPAARRRLIKDEFDRAGPVLHLLLRYTQALITQMAQTAVCNRHHSLDQQLCRWLLLSLDRLRGNELVMTQELIANMLGVRREGVTEAARKLQKAGLIQYARGHITVLDRAGPGAAHLRVLRGRQEGVRPAVAGHRGDLSRAQARRSAQRAQVSRERFDVGRRQRLRGRGHVAVHVEARARLEAEQLRAQVVGLLPGQARDVLLALQLGAVALRAEELLGQAARQGRRGGRERLAGRRRRLRREVAAELVDVGVAQGLGDRIHDRVLAVPLAEHDDLRRDELLRLAGERRHVGRHRAALGAVAALAQLDLLAQRLGPRRDGRGGSGQAEHAEGEAPAAAAARGSRRRHRA